VPEETRISRRTSLARLGGFVLATATGSAWKVANGQGATDADSASSGPSAVARGVVSCVLAPEMTEGPYYVPGDKVRRTITEGKPGVPLTLKLSVVDASTCRVVEGAAVDVWHCDAGGVYSETSVQGTAGRTFLRGIQRTNANGVATFRTIYPGWYTGRTVHVHVKVALGGNVVHTGQLFFPDRLTDAVYRRSPYNRRPARSTRNATDSIFRNGGSRSLLRLTRSGTGYVGTIAMGVQR
jgi:protocatechuate 3,4-dioxygenase beta subunit